MPVLVAEQSAVRWLEELGTELRMLVLHRPQPAEPPLIGSLVAAVPRTRTSNHAECFVEREGDRGRER
jgi:hypothetical protein